jgi:hypothetical protein
MIIRFVCGLFSFAKIRKFSSYVKLFSELLLVFLSYKSKKKSPDSFANQEKSY